MGRDFPRTTAEERGTIFHGATRVHLPKTSEICELGGIGDHAVGGEVESRDVRTRWRSKDPRHVENVGSVGNMSQGREGVGDDEARRDQRELRELHGEGGFTHDEEDRKRYMCWREPREG